MMVGRRVVSICKYHECWKYRAFCVSNFTQRRGEQTDNAGTPSFRLAVCLMRRNTGMITTEATRKVRVAPRHSGKGATDWRGAGWPSCSCRVASGSGRERT